MTALTAVPGPFRRAEHQPISVEIKIVRGLFVKSMLCPDAGTVVPQHSHEYDHMSMVAVGRVLVWRDEECLGPFEAPCGILIRAHAMHTFRTLTPGVLIYCIHRVDDDGEPAIVAEHHLNLED
jgi:hypothetical protein